MIETITDPAGRVHDYSYPDGFLETYTDPDGGVYDYDYETTGQEDRLKQITDPRGNKTTFTYTSGCLEWENPCRVTSIKRYRDATNYDETTFGYNDGAGSGDTCKKSSDSSPDSSITGHTVVTDARGNTTTYCWDKEMRIVFTKDQEGDARKNSWTANSNVTKYTAGSGAEGDAAYDTSNRVTSVQAPKGATGTAAGDRAENTFDYTGRGSENFFPASTTDTEGRTHNFSYSANSNVTEVKESGAASPQVKIDYHDGGTGEANNGTVKWSEDGRGNRINYSYDAKGNLTTIDPPGSSQGNITITYNTNLSRIATITDGKGQRREFTYDPLDRVTQIKFYNASNTLVRTDTYSYDDNGNRLTRVDASGSYSYTYDALNRMTEESRPGHATTLYSYDAMSNLTSITAAGEQTLFTYYPDNIVKEVKEPAEGSPATNPTTLFTYTKNNSRDTTTFANGVVEDVNYDDAERPKEIKATKSGTTLTHFKYTYLRSGQTKERALKQTFEDVRLGNTTRYTYDALSRLTQAQTTGTDPVTWSYQYDNASNRTSKANDWGSTTYAYNVANELCWSVSGTSSADCSTTPTGARTYTWDANGDLTGSSNGLAASYNVAKQTTDFKENSGASNTTFEYAGQGQKERTKKNSILFLDSVLGASAEKQYSYYKSYVRDNSGALVGMRTETARDRYYYLRDALGSVVALTDESGAVARRFIYNDPYGDDVTSQSFGSPPSNNYRFAGEYRDSETGLYKIGERYYYPTLGLWTQRDPMMQAFSPREVNGYGYVGGDPINLTDPTGLHTCTSYSVKAGVGPAFGFCEGGSVTIGAGGGPFVGATASESSGGGLSQQFCWATICEGLDNLGSPSEVSGFGFGYAVEINVEVDVWPFD